MCCVLPDLQCTVPNCMACGPLTPNNCAICKQNYVALPGGKCAKVRPAGGLPRLHSCCYVRELRC